MITTEEAEGITTLPRRQQGPAIDKALESLLANGRNHKEAFAELAEATGMQPNTIAQGFYRRKRQKGEGRPLVRVRSDVAPTPEIRGSIDPAQARAARRAEAEANGDLTVQEAFDAFRHALDAYVSTCVNERLAEARKALG